MASDAEVKIRVSTELDKRSLKADGRTLELYLSSTVSEARDLSMLYNTMKKKSGSAVISQDKLTNAIAKFRSVVSDISSSILSIDDTNISPYTDALKRVISTVQVLRVELGGILSYLNKMEAPRDNLDVYNNALSTLKSMKSVLESVQKSWLTLVHDWDTEAGTLDTYTDSVRNFMSLLDSSSSTSYFKDIISDLDLLEPSIASFKNTVKDLEGTESTLGNSYELDRGLLARLVSASDEMVSIKTKLDIATKSADAFWKSFTGDTYSHGNIQDYTQPFRPETPPGTKQVKYLPMVRPEGNLFDTLFPKEEIKGVEVSLDNDSKKELIEDLETVKDEVADVKAELSDASKEANKFWKSIPSKSFDFNGLKGDIQQFRNELRPLEEDTARFIPVGDIKSEYNEDALKGLKDFEGTYNLLLSGGKLSSVIDDATSSTSKLNSETESTTFSVKELNKEAEKTSSNLAELEEVSSDINNEVSQIDLSKVQSQTEVIKENLKEAEDAVKGTDTTVDLDVEQEEFKVADFTPTLEQIEEAKDKLRSLADITDKGTGEWNAWQWTMKNALGAFFKEYESIENALNGDDNAISAYFSNVVPEESLATLEASVSLMEDYIKTRITDGKAFSKAMTGYLNDIGYSSKEDKKYFKENTFDYSDIGNFKEYINQAKSAYDFIIPQMKKETVEELEEVEDASESFLDELEAAEEGTEDLQEAVDSVDTSDAVEEIKEMSAEVKALRDELQDPLIKEGTGNLTQAWGNTIIKAFNQIYDSYSRLLLLYDANEGNIVPEVADLDLNKLSNEFEAATSLIDDYRKSSYYSKSTIDYAKSSAARVYGDVEVTGNTNKFFDIYNLDTDGYSKLHRYFEYYRDTFESLVETAKDSVSDLEDSQSDLEASTDNVVSEISQGTADIEKELDKRARVIKDYVSSRLESNPRIKEHEDTYKDTLNNIKEETKQSDDRRELDEKVRLSKKIAEIRRSTSSDELQSQKILALRESSAIDSNYKKELSSVEAIKKKRLAYIDLWKSTSKEAADAVHADALNDAETEYNNELAKIQARQEYLNLNSAHLLESQKRAIETEIADRKVAARKDYDLRVSYLEKLHDLSLKQIDERAAKSAEKVMSAYYKGKDTAKLSYIESLDKDPQGTPEKPVDTSNLKKEVYDTLKSETGKLLNLFKRGVKSVWSNYTKYGKGAIQTVSSLFKTTLQKTFSGSKKINEMLGLSKGTQEANNFTEALRKMKSELLGIAGVSISLKTLLGTTEASSELIEMQNVVDTVFGDMSDSVNAFAKSANTSLGLTEFQAKKFTSIFGSMFKTSGVSVESSRLMGENLTALSADLASFFDADFTEAFDKVKSGLAGMIMPLRAYGIDLSVASMQQYMLDKGIQATWKDLSIAEKQMVRYNYMMERTTDMQGDFAKTAGSWANQLRLLKNQVRELAVMVGSFLEMHIYPAIRGLNNFLGVLIKVGRELQKIFHFESKDLLEQQGLADVNKGIAVDIGYDEEESEIDDLTSSTDKLTEAKKKLQKQNERQEASFDSLIKLSKQSTDANDAETKGTTSKDKGKGKGAGLNLKPLDYGKGLDLSKAPIKLPKWAQRIIKWAREIEGLFDKYGKKIKKKVEEMQEAWSPVSDKLGKVVDWLWGTVLKPFIEWLLKEAIPKTIDLLKTLGGVVDSVMGPIGEVVKGVWESVLEPFFKSIGTKYIKWVEKSSRSLKNWKKEFDKLDTVEKKLDFLKNSIKKWFEGTIQKIFGEKSDEVLKHFYSSWDSLRGVFDNIFSSSEEMAKGTLFSEEFRTAVENLAGAFGELASNHFSNITGLLKTITDNQVPLSEVAGSLASGFSSIETMVFDGIETLINTMANNKDGVVGVVDSLTSLVTEVGGAVFSGLNTTLDKLVSSGTASYYIRIIKDALVRISELAFDTLDSLIDWLGDEKTKSNVEKIKDNIVDAFENITDFITNHKEDALELITGASGLIKWATEHPGAVAAALIGGDLLGTLGSISTKILGVGGAIQLLGSLISNPLVLIISGILLAYGLFKGLQEQFDAHSDMIEQSEKLVEASIETQKRLGNNEAALDTTKLENYSGLLEELGLTVTSTGEVFAEEWGAFNNFTKVIQDSSQATESTIETYRKSLEKYGFATKDAIEEMSNEEVVNAYKTAVLEASGAISSTLDDNTKMLELTIDDKKVVLKDYIKDISGWGQTIVDESLKSVDSGIDQMNQIYNNESFSRIQETIRDRTAEIVEMTGELPLSVVNDIGRMLQAGLNPEDFDIYFDSYIAAISEPAEATEDAAKKMEDASGSMEKSTKEVQKSADAVDLENAVESIKGLADAYDEATDASNRMKLSSSIDKLLDYYQKLYINGQLSAEEYANHINRLTDYKLKLEEATDGILDVMREARTGQDNEQQLFSEEQTAHFEALASQFGSDVNGLKEAMIGSVGKLNFTDEQRKFFYEQMVPKMDDFIKEDISENVGNELGSTYDKGIEKANNKITNKIEIEASVPDPNSKEANEASDKAEKVGKGTGKSLTEGAQGEVDSNKLSTDTYVENGSEKNKETANKEGTKVGKEVTKATKAEIDNSTFSLGKAFENAKDENTETAIKAGGDTAKIALSEMRKTVRLSKIDLADALHVEISAKRIDYIANAINYLLISAFSRVQKIDLSSKLTFSGTSSSLPVAHGNSILSEVKTRDIPHLAKGAVIPPRSRFLAVLGDQRSGYNIETPLDTMVDAFKIALQDSGLLNRGESDQPIQLTVQIGSEKLDDRIINVVDGRNVRSGGL